MKKLFFFIIIVPSFSVQAYSQFRLQEAFPNLTFPYITEMVSAQDGTNRIFVTTQRGIVYAFPNDSAVAAAKIFLDLSDIASQTGEETGLLGLAFHPNYKNNGYFYVDYTTEQPPLRIIVARFSVSSSNPDSALKSSELVILSVTKQYSHHNGGRLVFGPDGYLYISVGDGGSEGDLENNGQNRSVLFGKILRINIDSASSGNNYSIPVSNPFYGNTQGFRQEIFTWGMRNTWKFSFDLPAGRIWAADVGESSWEEIDLLESGKNYGWRKMEGFACYNPSNGCDTAGLTKPIWAYGRSEGQCITGGYVYRGPTQYMLTGRYIYADYIEGRIWALACDSLPVCSQLLYDSPYMISTFGLDQNNELYVCSYSFLGKVYKFKPVAIEVEHKTIVPQNYELEQNYPNPFNPVTTITFVVPEESFITVKVFNSLGQEVETLVNEIKQAGSYEVSWDGSENASGVYFYNMTAVSSSGNKEADIEKKMVLIK